MAKPFVHIPASRAAAAAEYLRERKPRVMATIDADLEKVKEGFFKKSVNKDWARWFTPGVWFKRKILNRRESDDLFDKVYNRKHEDPPWPYWMMGWLEEFARHEQRRKRWGEFFDETIATLSASLDVYMPQGEFQGILALDEFFAYDPSDEDVSAHNPPIHLLGSS